MNIGGKMLTSSMKNKGRRLQQSIVKIILDKFSKLTKNDVRSISMGKSGMDIELSEAARKKFPYAVEAKNTERLNIWSAIEQAESANRDLTPIVVFKRNRSEIYVTLKLDDFMELV